MQRKVKWLKIIGLILGVVVVVCTLSITPTTFSYFITRENISNQFENGKVDIEVDENFTSPTQWDGTPWTKMVRIKNVGTTHSLIRVAIVPRWENLDGTPFAGDTSLLTITFANVGSTPGWRDGGDGYYYYNLKVGTGLSTNEIVTEVAFAPNIEELILERYKDKKLIVDVQAEAILASTEAYQAIWPQMANSNSSVDIMLESLIVTP